jgi:defect-in-organelle-trafficking protein DotD
MTRLPLAALIVGGLTLAGCGAIPVPTTVATPGMPNPEQALRNSMQHVDAEMAQLGSLSPVARRSAGPVPPEDLQRIVSFTWNGPLDDGVAKLAQSIGYTFYTTGPSNHQPVPVAVEIGPVPAYQVFQMLGDQAGRLATVQVDPVHHQVHVIHHG